MDFARDRAGFPFINGIILLLVFNGLNQYNDRITIYVDGKREPLNVLQSNFYLYWGCRTPLRIGVEVAHSSVQRRNG